MSEQMPDIQSMNEADFDFLAKFLKENAGLSLTQSKGYLIKSRLAPLMKENDFNDISDIVAGIKNGNSKLKEQVINSMVTHETLFFRDKKPFEALENILIPEIIERKKSVEKSSGKKIRIWSAACSSGQEPYSIAMMLKEMGGKLQGFDIEIVATDISKNIIEKARTGIYSQFEVQRGLPVKLLIKYFEQNGLDMAINDDIKSMIKFSTFNLLDNPVSMGHFDIIFCRNVLIYFNNEDKAKVVGNFYNILNQGGYLVLGGTETLFGVTDKFSSLKDLRGIYQK